MIDAEQKKIVVVIVISNMEYGGAQRQIVELANNIDSTRFDLHVCSLSDYVPIGPLIEDAEHRLHIISKKNKYDVSVIWRLATLLRRLRADIVHGYLFDAEIATRLAGRLARISSVGNCERNTNYAFKRIHLLTYRITRPFVDFYVANSTAGATFNQHMLSNKRSMYYTVHNGVDTKRFHRRDGSDIRASLGIPADAFVVGMFGSFKEQKNHAMLFQAVRPLLDRHPHTRLLLVGDELAGGMHGSTDYKTRTLALVEELGLKDICVFAGNRDDVELLYPACDVTALPSLFEGTPNVALESMACGIPVVATNVSDNAYVIRDEETGFVVDLTDVKSFSNRLCLLADDNELRTRLGRHAIEWMEKEFSCAQLARKTESVYLDVLGRLADQSKSGKSFQSD